MADSGYQALDKLHARTDIPFKATNNKPLDKEAKAYNRVFSRMRVKIENVLKQLKSLEFSQIVTAIRTNAII